MKIVYVHGRAQEGKDKTLLGEWDNILRAALDLAKLGWPQNVTSVAPFYGDILDLRTRQADKGDLFGLVRKGSSDADDAAKRQFYREFLGEIAAAQGITRPIWPRKITSRSQRALRIGAP